jgi:glutamate synthase (ferredoxin)
VRQGLAQLGLRSLDELVGHADYLQQRDAPLAKTSGLDLSFLTTYAGDSGTSSIRIAQAVHSNGPQLDDEILADKDVQNAIRTQVRSACWLCIVAVHCDRRVMCFELFGGMVISATH